MNPLEEKINYLQRCIKAMRREIVPKRFKAHFIVDMMDVKRHMDTITPERYMFGRKRPPDARLN